MNRQKREEAQRNSNKSGDQAGQPDRSSPPDRDRMRNRENKETPERQQPERESGRLPLPD